MAGDALQMDTKKLTALASDIRKRQQAMYTGIENAKAQIGSLKSIWTGGSAEAYQSQFAALYGRCGEVLAEAEKLATSLNVVVENALAGQKKMQQMGESARKLPEITVR